MSKESRGWKSGEFPFAEAYQHRNVFFSLSARVSLQILKAGRVCYIIGVRDVRNPQGQLGGSFSEVSTLRPACRMLPRVLIFAVLFSKEVVPAEGASAGMERDPEHGTCEPEFKFPQSQACPCPVVCGLPETKELSSKRGQRGERSRRRPPSRQRGAAEARAPGASEVAGVRSALRASDVRR
jgi:hypothetical protein